MPTRSAFRFDPKAIIGSFVTGVIFVVLLTWMNGNAFGAPTFPLLAMTSGFILAGVSYGYLSEGETVLEPALAAILVALASYAIITALDLRCFDGLVENGTYTYMMVISFMNGLILTFAGAWAGEKLERTYAGSGKPAMEWGWIVAGSILGLAVSLFLANLVIWLFGLFASPIAALEPENAWVMLFVVFLGLQATGYVCAFRSPGDTSYEAAVSGLITLILLIDVFVFTLAGQSILSYLRMSLVLFVGLLASLVGGYVGERMQVEVEGPHPTEA
ncbi:hypothetical protein BSZ35_10220 [Salinibacter sp. 10B]|uniref:hypothetical protein n=1 Tax=Salinibacter sp. 10B TaxID=1923971 RepID=UPI000CF39EEA|nr:hypothetical protein [Salinibacter sp. 10B]PQJ34922.1 hypothetical protein BSZ35_10220 [Salinibacter sp. 10B]